MDSIKRVLAKFKDMVESYGARALLASLLVMATACAGSVSTLFAIDGEATATACASMAFYGFCVGWLCKWAVVEKLPICKMRRTIGSLPRDQRAVLFAAYAKRGAFRCVGGSSSKDAEGEILAIESLGIIVRIKGSVVPTWSLSADAQRLLDNSARLRRELEEDHAAWSAEAERKEHRRLLEAAKGDLLRLDRFGTMTIGDLLEADSAVELDEDGMNAIVNHVGNRLLDITRMRDGKYSIKASAIAREAAPLVFADLRIE